MLTAAKGKQERSGQKRRRETSRPTRDDFSLNSDRSTPNGTSLSTALRTMSSPREFRLPPIRAILALVGVLAVLSHFSAVHHSEAYSNRISSLRTYLGLGSDGMPLSARVSLGHAAAGAGAATSEVDRQVVSDDGGHSLAFSESSVSRGCAHLSPVRRTAQAHHSISPPSPLARRSPTARQLDPRQASQRHFLYPRTQLGPVGHTQEHPRHGG